MDDQEYILITQKIRRLLGINLDNYKSQQMRRRLSGLVSGQDVDVAQYCKLIETDREALRKLKNFLTINVSEFFRDVEQFNQLREKILPELLKASPRLSVWSAGCSHGGEPYSLAMLLEELAPGQRHRVLATDLDDEILARAKKGGPYSESDVNNVNNKYILKYFTKAEDGFHVIDQIRQKVEFRRQNLMSDAFERGFDLILCRNVVIYFSDEAKTKLYQGFYDSLKGDGVLFIGATEALLGASELGLERICNCFYRRPSGDASAPKQPRTAAV